MIPEASGARPVGIFLLADEYLKAAQTVDLSARKFTNGPTRLLCYHACELYLKAFLRDRGEDVDTLRAYGHDLSKMLDRAKSEGLLLSKQAQDTIGEVVEKNDYVRVRYMVVETKEDLRPSEVLDLTTRIRDAVRDVLRLDELGMPIKD
jgi:HEPN domain-containing protein